MPRDLSKIPVEDSFGAAADPALPTVALALDRTTACAAFKRGLARLAGPRGIVRVKGIKVTRHKPGKRAVIEYEVRVDREGGEREWVTLIGKIRAKRYGNEACRLQELVWDAGFQSDSADGVSVPEPIGVLPELRIWLQRKVPGEVAGGAFVGSGGLALARTVAFGIHKLHRAGVPTDRAHTMEDELRILHDCLGKVIAAQPALKPGLKKILTACDRLGASVPEPKACGIHRDFYPAQVIVDGARLNLIDFDLYCLGDPALDVGNFIGHMIEESLRTRGSATALHEYEQALEDRFVELSGEATRPAVRAYTTLTLVRHIYLSTLFPERTPFTEKFMARCEQRLGG